MTLTYGSAAPTDPTVSARRRLAAITAGTVSSVAIAAFAIVWSRDELVVGYAHAIAILIFVANAVLAARVIVPIPGLGGWALLLALIDWRRPGDPWRIVTASRAAKVLSMPLMILVAALGLAVGVPTVALAALPLGLVVWLQADRAAFTDIRDRFPRTAHCPGRRPIADLVPARRRPGSASHLGSAGRLHGARSGCRTARLYRPPSGRPRIGNDRTAGAVPRRRGPR